MIYQVYWNKTKECYSIRHPDGYVVGHAKEVLMHDCEFVVSAKGRDRVRATGHKTVHAWVEGTIHRTIGFKDYKARGFRLTDAHSSERTMAPLRYNPMVDDSFCVNESPWCTYVTGAEVVHLGPDRLMQAGGLTVE